MRQHDGHERNPDDTGGACLHCGRSAIEQIGTPCGGPPSALVIQPGTFMFRPSVDIASIIAERDRLRQELLDRDESEREIRPVIDAALALADWCDSVAAQGHPDFIIVPERLAVYRAAKAEVAK